MKTLKLMSICFVLIFILLFFGNLQAQTKVFSEAKGSGKYQESYDFDKWNFSVGNDRYEIGKNGKAKRNTGNRAVNFVVKLDTDEEIERVIYFTEYKGDLLLICEVEVADGGAAFIARLDGKTLKTKWQENISGFNVAKGLIENNTAYLAAIGFAAKIDLETGKYLWKHDDFYRKYKEDGAFNIFEVPTIERNIITFTEKQDTYKRPPNIIKFNKTNGEIIEVKVN